MGRDRTPFWACLLFVALAAATCSGDGDGGAEAESEAESEGDCAFTLAPSEDDHTAVQQALIDAQEGDTLCFAPGTYRFTSELSLHAPGVTLRGGGKAELDFSGQTMGGNGLRIDSDNVTVDGLAVYDTPGDGLRIDMAAGLTIRNTRVEWRGKPSAENGAYGIYPVQCTRALLEDNVVRGASDAGIYLGQSETVIIRRNETVENVIGIEIENSTDVDVYENTARENTAGIFVPNLPNLPVQDGRRTRVFDNVVEDNNTPNFGDPSSLVSKVPAGTGVLVMASDDNEVFGNTIRGHGSLGAGVMSWCAALEPYDDANYDPYSQGNAFHDNTIEDNGQNPMEIALIIADEILMRDTLADMVTDGVIDPGLDNSDGSLTNCWKDNGAATFLNFDLAGSGASPFDFCDATHSEAGMVEEDASAYDCEHAGRDPISF